MEVSNDFVECFPKIKCGFFFVQQNFIHNTALSTQDEQEWVTELPSAAKRTFSPLSVIWANRNWWECCWV